MVQSIMHVIMSGAIFTAVTHNSDPGEEKKPMASKITKTAKLRSNPLAGAMLLVEGVN